MKDCYLVFENGLVYKGKSFGSEKDVVGELVFTTCMSGYQESMTDPSFTGQILTFTYPLIGNYGINRDNYESLSSSCAAVVVKDVARRPSHFKAKMSIDEFCKLKDIPGITGVDTRSIAKFLRDNGVTRASLIHDAAKLAEVSESLKHTQIDMQVKNVSTKTSYMCPGTGFNIALIDFGVKENIIRELTKRKCQVTVFPYNVSAEEVKKYNPDGIVLSNGPGNPEDMVEAIKLVQDLQGEIPIFGICLGHQILGLANNAKTYKMKFGHRGYNHPVKEIATGATYFTAQNHGYAIEPDSIEQTKLIVTHIEINDNTIEGIKHRNHPAFSVQFHPEATPGPFDARYLFDEFMDMINAFQGK